MVIQLHSAAPPDSQSARSLNAPIGPEQATFHEALSQASSDGGKIADAAKQFEALIAGQVLKAARESTEGGWLGNDADQTGELTLEMAEQAFAQALAAKGSFGIAKLVTAGLERKQP